MKELTAERVRELLIYDPDTGIFRWRISGHGVKVGDIAGRINLHGYRQISIDHRYRRAARLAWLYVYGCWPSGQIDHKNTMRDDDRLVNLRDATLAVNAQNQRRAQRNNKTGMLGVSQQDGRFKACIRINGKQRYLGNFATPDEAHTAYLVAKRRFHPGCTL